MVKDVLNITIAIRYKVTYWLFIGVFTFNLDISKGQGHGNVKFRQLISCKW